MRTKTSDLRWAKAQAYEKDFWAGQATRPAGDARFAWYEERARMIWKIARPLIGYRQPTSVLEIGSGPVGLVNYIEADERMAVDPLERYYRTQPDFTRVRDKAVIRSDGRGEDIAALGRQFSFIVIDNVLDHMKDPGRVLSAINGSLAEDGVMFLSLNIYTDFGVLVRNAMELFQIDKGHPFNFSRQSILSLIKEQRLPNISTFTQ